MHVNRGGAIPVKHVSRFQQTHGKFTVLAGDEGFIPPSNGVERCAAVHDKGRYLRRFSPTELAELPTAATDGRCQGPVDPTCCSRRRLVCRQDPDAQAREAVSDFILTRRPRLETGFEVISAEPWRDRSVQPGTQRYPARWKGPGFERGRRFDLGFP